MNLAEDHIKSDNILPLLRDMTSNNRLTTQKSDAAYKLLRQALNNNAEALFAIKQQEVMEDLVLLVTMTSLDDYQNKETKWKFLPANISKKYNKIVTACSVIYDYAYDRGVTIAQSRKDNMDSGFENIMDDFETYYCR